MSTGNSPPRRPANITAATVRQIAETVVDYISVGWVTHSTPALDVSLAVGRLPCRLKRGSD